MALIPEDGSNVADANSFVEAADIVAYAIARGVVITEDQATINGIKAMDYLYSLCFNGDLVYDDQIVPWPRKGVVEGDEGDDWVYTIPANIIRAQLQLSLDAFNGIELLPSRPADAQIKREKIGPIETEYFGPASYAPDIPFAASLLQPFLCVGSFRLKTYRV